MDKFNKRMATALQPVRPDPSPAPRTNDIFHLRHIPPPNHRTTHRTPHPPQVDLTKAASDEYVHFGDVVQLENVTSGAVVAVDVESRDPRPAENSCAVSASFHVEACARNTFTLEPYIPRTAKAAAMMPVYDDDVLHYGQKVKLVVNPAATDGSNWNVEKCFVRSFAVSQTHFAKYSRRGEVVASGNDSYECVFEILTPDPAKRLVSEGVPVMAGAPVVLLHCQSNQVSLFLFLAIFWQFLAMVCMGNSADVVFFSQCLCVGTHGFANDFGTELEVCGHTATSVGNSYKMEGLATGVPGSLKERAPQDCNVFAIVGKPTVVA